MQLLDPDVGSDDHRLYDTLYIGKQQTHIRVYHFLSYWLGWMGGDVK